MIIECSGVRHLNEDKVCVPNVGAWAGIVVAVVVVMGPFSYCMCVGVYVRVKGRLRDRGWGEEQRQEHEQQLECQRELYIAQHRAEFRRQGRQEQQERRIQQEREAREQQQEQHEFFRDNTLSPATSFLVPSAERYFTSEPPISPSAPTVQSEHQLDELFTQDVEKSELSEISEGPPAYKMLFPNRNPNSNRFTISHLST